MGLGAIFAICYFAKEILVVILALGAWLGEESPQNGAGNGNN
jgi:hypothetical protein